MTGYRVPEVTVARKGEWSSGEVVVIVSMIHSKYMCVESDFGGMLHLKRRGLFFGGC